MLGAGNDQRRQGVGVCPKLRLGHSRERRLEVREGLEDVLVGHVRRRDSDMPHE
jgi:hypothetical protein